MLVAGIGQCSLDYLALVDAWPEADTKEEVLLWEEQGGGPVATALAALSRLGVRCRFAGVAGDDPEGEKIRRSLEAEGVEAPGLIVRPGASSQTAFIVVERGTARRTIFWRRPSGRPLAPGELPAGFLEGSSFLLLDGLMEEVSMHAAGEARRLGVPVMLDAGRVREKTVALAGLSDYVVGSEEFARGLGWSGEAEGFKKTASGLCPGVVTITLGERGSVTYAGGEVLRQGAFPVEAVDSTGAGDVFHGGYVYGLLRGWGLRETLRFASALAAMKCTRLGGRAGIPGLAGVEAFLRERG
ncbi:MAG: sugar kinase [Thermodesulfovibrionales bacterium]